MGKYKKVNIVKKVAEFHKFTKNGILKKPGFPSQDRMDLRVRLIEEELEELKVAIKERDFIEVADALTDILYVTIGSFLEFGLGKLLPKLFNEVHRSNMTKFCTTLEEVAKNREWYRSKGKEIGFYEVKDSKGNTVYCLYNMAGGKTLKSQDYSQVDFTKIIKLKNKK